MTPFIWSSSPSSPIRPGRGQLHLWWIALDQVTLQADLILNREELARADKVVSKEKRHQFTAARASLRVILGSYLNLDPVEIVFSYGNKGKPALDNPDPGLEFNIAHSGNRALLAITCDQPVGVDLEAVKQRRNGRSIAKRVFHDEQWQLISHLDGDSFTAAFLTQWAIHEARIKALGEGVMTKLPSGMEVPARTITPAKGWVGAVAMQEELPVTTEWRGFRFGAV
ncbi:MAG: 4'-phosphopantetheinyl transferase superfamily protein [Gammaproteobacteria bacterium]|nr:4'-phosphopantetheinyl transferase superfamily protein [Gammaproteobacteria bacterium]